MNRLTKNFNFVTNDKVANLILIIEQKFEDKEYDIIPKNAWKIAEILLINNYEFKVDTLNNMIATFKERFSKPLVTDALFLIKKIGNINMNLKTNEYTYDKVDMLYLIKSLSILCQDAYNITKEYSFYENAYQNNILIENKRKTSDVISIRNNELIIQKQSMLYWFKNPKYIFIIPFYQRRYTWNEDNLQTLWNDILDRSKDKFQHYFGVIALKKDLNDLDNIMLKIIDGQQRITTSLLLLRAALDTFIKNSWFQPDYLTDIFVKHKIYDRFKNNSALEGSHEEFLAILEGRFIQTKMSWSYGKNYKIFLNLFANLGGLNEVKDFVETFIVKFEIAELKYDIKPDREMDIFENMNSKGTDLKEWDLIRNQIFNVSIIENLTDKEKLLMMKSTFEDSFRANSSKTELELEQFFIEFCHLKNIKNGTEYRKYNRFPVYNNFKFLYQKNIFKTEKLYQEFLNEIKKYTIIYKALIIKDLSYMSSEKNIRHYQKRVNNITSKKIIGFILFLLVELNFNWSGEKWVAKNANSVKIFNDSILYVDSLLVRIELTSGFGHSLRNILQKLAVELNTNKKSTVNTINEFIMRENIDGEIIMPSNDEVREKLLSGNTFTKKGSFVKDILTQLDLYFQDTTQSGQFEINMISPSLEHVMPRKPENWKNNLVEQDAINEFEIKHKEYLNKIGNYLLLPQSINSSVSNSKFSSKKAELIKFRIPMIMGSKKWGIQPMEDINEWNFIVIDKRTEIISEILITKIYPLKK